MAQNSENIIKTYPELSAFQIEYQGDVYECNRCMGKGKCCGAQNDKYSDQIACIKCRCQHLHDVIDDSRKEKVKQPNCEECDDSTFSKSYCESLGYLNNNLKANITDCSNNFLNVGSNSTIQDVELRSECNVGGEQNVNVITPNKQSNSGLPFDKKYLMIGGGVLFIIILLFLFL